jgi:hypothetical protein
MNVNAVNSYWAAYTRLTSIYNPQTRVNMARAILQNQTFLAISRQTGTYEALAGMAGFAPAAAARPAGPAQAAMRAVAFQGQQGQQPYRGHTVSSDSRPRQQTAIVMHAEQPIQRREDLKTAEQRAREAMEADIAARRRQFDDEWQRRRQSYLKGITEEAANAYTFMGLDPKEPLTMAKLRSAYKRLAMRHHPDRGGSSETFQKLTKCFFALYETLDDAENVDGAASAAAHRTARGVAKGTIAIEDVPDYDDRRENQRPAAMSRLNPGKGKFDVKEFNRLFENYKIKDPSQEKGYGDWLKSEEEPEPPGPVFGGKFNQDVFAAMFEEKERTKATGALVEYRAPESLALAPTAGVSVGFEEGNDYTAAMGSDLQFTDLKAAYTTQNTVTSQVLSARDRITTGTVTGAAVQRLEAARSEAIVQTPEERLRLANEERIKAAAEYERQQRLTAYERHMQQYQARLNAGLIVDRE